MKTFYYLAINSAGCHQKGTLQATHLTQAKSQLRATGLIPIQLREQNTFPSLFSWLSRLPFIKRLSNKKLSHHDLSLITQQLATLLSAGLPLEHALIAVAKQSEKTYIKNILMIICHKIKEGYTLETSLSAFPLAFPSLYRKTIGSGEQTGKLTLILHKLAEHTEKQNKIRQTVQQALIYPILMTSISISIIFFLLTYIVPKITGIFEQTQQALPMPTRLLMASSHFLGTHSVSILLGILLCILLFRQLLKKTKIRLWWDTLLLKTPLLGNSILMINSARFARTLGILCTASVPILEAMQKASQLIGPLPMQKAVKIAIDDVRKGMSLHHTLQKTHYFPPILINLIASGESSGQLENMLLKAAKTQEDAMQSLIARLLALFEPLMILIMGGVVLFIVLAIMLPIFKMNNAIG